MATEAEKEGRAALKIDAKRGLLITTQLATRRAATHDLQIEAGRSYSLVISWLDGDTAEVRDMSAYTAKFQIRSHPGAATAHVSLTQASGITLAATEPNILVVLTAAQATALAAAITRGVYELTVTTGSTTVRLLEGCVAAIKAVAV
jgi:hypothetical protein